MWSRIRALPYWTPPSRWHSGFSTHTGSIRDQKMEIEAAYEQMQVANDELQATQADLIRACRGSGRKREDVQVAVREGADRDRISPDGLRRRWKAGRTISSSRPIPRYEKMTGVVDPSGKLVTDVFPGIEHDPFDWISTYGEVALTGKEIRFQQHLELNDRWYEIVAYPEQAGSFRDNLLRDNRAEADGRGAPGEASGNSGIPSGTCRLASSCRVPMPRYC